MADLDSLWGDNEIQFARFIVEMVAVTPNLDAVIEQMAASMNLEPLDVYELFDRAEFTFEDTKENL